MTTNSNECLTVIVDAAGEILDWEVCKWSDFSCNATDYRNLCGRCRFCMNLEVEDDGSAALVYSLDANGDLDDGAFCHYSQWDHNLVAPILNQVKIAREELNRDYERSTMAFQVNPTVLENARQAAMNEALGAPTKLVQESIESMLSSAPKALQEPVERLKDSQKPKGRVVQHYLCDHCSDPIMKPSDGFVIEGNIYIADPTMRGGIIGNNFPKFDENGRIAVNEIRSDVLCKQCLWKMLNSVATAPRATQPRAKMAPVAVSGSSAAGGIEQIFADVSHANPAF